MKFLKTLSALAVLMPAVAIGQQAVTVDLSVAPATGAGSVTPVLTWSSTNATSCTASGGWTGSKAISGTETLAARTTGAAYTLTCQSSTGSATLTWTPPTQRTDGTPLTNLSQYSIFVGTTSSNLVRQQNIAAPSTTYVLNGLTSGTKFMAMTAIDAGGAESALSNTVSKNIVPPSGSATATLTVTTLPRPPTNVGVQ